MSHRECSRKPVRSLPSLAFAILLVRLSAKVALAADAPPPPPIQAPFPVSVPAVGYWQNATDLSHLNHRPAGKHGFITVRGPHFHLGSGGRIRFLGGGLIRNACFPTHDMADGLAKRLAMTGFNLVRVHHIDTTWAPKGIWARSHQAKQHLDHDQLERFDYLISRLKAEGVYTNINLHVSREFTDADGCPHMEALPRMAKGVSIFDARMIELQKTFARNLLTHANPYTGLRYVDEPAIAAVEINNENSLLGLVLQGKLHRLPPHYEDQLQRAWNAWLLARYENTEKLVETWKPERHEQGPQLLRNSDLSDGTDHWEQQYEDLMLLAVTDADPGHNRALHITCTRPGPLPWTMQTHQIHLDFTPDTLYTFAFRIRARANAKVDVIARLDHPSPETGRFDVVGLKQRIRATPEWERHTLTFRARTPSKGGNRIGFTFPNEANEFWLSDVSLTKGGRAGGPGPGESLEKRNVSRPFANNATTAEWQDWIACVSDLETDYFLDMAKFLREDLGVRCPVIGSQVSYGGIGGALRESQLDYGDMHAYWQHPRFPRKPWDGKDWEIANTPMIADPDNSIALRLAHCRLANKPFVISEFNHPCPSWYAAEAWPVMASIAALQDWDGLVVHNYLNYGCEHWEERRWSGFFDTATRPEMMAFLPAAAIIFRDGGVTPLPEETRLELPREGLPKLMAQGTWSPGDLWGKAAGKGSILLASRLSLALTKTTTPTVRHSSSGQPSAPQVRWENSDDLSLYTVTTPCAQVAAGHLSDRVVTLNDTILEVGPCSTGFAVAALVAVDGHPTAQSQRLLFSLVGRSENTGWTWREDGKMLTSWGRNPKVVEGISCTLTFRNENPEGQAFALDGAGNRVSELKLGRDHGRTEFELSPDHQTMWVEFDFRAQP
ncbi:MAG: hypothetical protein HN742_19615 [Lentisphaerae bacterium]|jgi:hypothetical protein|nr:hypothetical protein [Lentisphaerota bacterium]MBT4815849.1 hypothetical protein [Lentisphaerota bacterium]MBT5608008.1 hypothetical protein [Lentisphaerota bacterium]MBT7060668.1 hypothetical protein [Lentisphaerota bacterium]MBT7844098.1 hypothetical protein [Lentisphaerota bacterium]